MNYEANYYAAPGLRNVDLPFNEKKADNLFSRISERYGVSYEDLTGPSRKRQYVFPRHLLMAALRKHTGMTLLQISALFNRHHTSVIHAVEEINNYIQTDSFGRREEILSFY